jgi:hypothetical protein
MRLFPRFPRSTSAVTTIFSLCWFGLALVFGDAAYAQTQTTRDPLMRSGISDSAKSFNPTPQQLTPPFAETYGTASEVVIAVHETEFNPYTSTTTFAWNAGRYVTGFVGFGALQAGIHLPAGASITRMELQACDTNAASSGFLNLEFITNSSGVGTVLATVNTGATPGCALFPVTLSSPHTVNNAMNSYYLLWGNNNVTDGTIKIQAARVFYKLQISPDPSTATFADVPVGHPFHRFVEALVAAGITGGCGGGNYCPDAPVTRGQMAVFLSAALGLHWAP